MKTTATYFSLSFFIILSMLFSHCGEKERPRSTITLYNQPLSVIQDTLEGKWELHYGIGGICATCYHDFGNIFWEFTPNGRIKGYSGATLKLDTILIWYKDRWGYPDTDSAYVMGYFDKLGYPNDYMVDGIYNDTLIIHTNASDAIFYRFTKLSDDPQ
ncbi:hypothetical protein IFO69_10295 [Echinicola sp. CAU 1574]|uniref:Uncharacterized protein n=1 Tax=Echinicola arenosa TaxID=2774144 RepID=A0ABR9AJY0_9BACT|nr:hypothetical protein [Echinicola arenosa]MBD8489135.1 hypothetical protein [Echinicola arenosa]